LNPEVLIMSLAWLSVIVPVVLMAFALGLERLEERLLGPAEPRSDDRQRPGARSAGKKIRTAVGRPFVGVLVGGLLVGCAGTKPQADTDGAAGGTSPPASAAAGVPDAASGTAIGESPADLALRLEALLGQHSVLASDMMRSRIRNDEDFVQAATTAVERNTDDLTAVVAALLGQQSADTFRAMWTDHVTAFFTYARGVAVGDAAARDDARGHLLQFENGLGDFISAASQGRLTRDAARSTLMVHDDHLLQQADAYAARDYERAAEAYRQGYSHAFSIGHGLAAALLPPDQSAALDQPSWRLRSELDRVLGEHVVLAVATLRAGAMNSPDFAAEAGALNGNSEDLTAAIATLLGAEAGQRFLSLWADHVEALVGYTGLVASDDDTRRQAALGELREYESELATFLDAATGSRVHASDLATEFLAHDQMLTQQADAVVDKDFPRAHELAYDCYRGMFVLSRQLSDAFGETVAARLPRGGAETGAGGTSGAR
jgi:hypothetical protein